MLFNTGQRSTAARMIWRYFTTTCCAHRLWNRVATVGLLCVAAARFRLAIAEIVDDCGRKRTLGSARALPIAANEQNAAGGDLELFSAERHRDRSASAPEGFPFFQP